MVVSWAPLGAKTPPGTRLLTTELWLSIARACCCSRVAFWATSSGRLLMIRARSSTLLVSRMLSAWKGTTSGKSCWGRVW